MRRQRTRSPELAPIENQCDEETTRNVALRDCEIPLRPRGIPTSRARLWHRSRCCRLSSASSCGRALPVFVVHDGDGAVGVHRSIRSIRPATLVAPICTSNHSSVWNFGARVGRLRVPSKNSVAIAPVLASGTSRAGIDPGFCNQPDHHETVGSTQRRSLARLRRTGIVVGSKNAMHRRTITGRRP